MKTQNNKMKRKNFISIFLGGLVFISLFGCTDYLENTNKVVLTDATQWSSESNADIFLNDIYNNLNDWYNEWTKAPESLDNYTDDNDSNNYYTSWNWKQGIINPSSDWYWIWGADTGPACMDRLNWPSAYFVIRKCNLFLQQVEANKSNYSEEWYNKRVDEVRFLRAFYYTNIWMHLGGVSIITEPQTREMEESQLYVPRSTFKETFDFIRGELATVVDNGILPVKYNAGNSDAGRATLGAALMLKGWIELYAASPAFNAEEPAVGADPNMVAGFNNYDITRWEDAAATFKKFMDEYAGTYSLSSTADLAKIWYESNEYNSEVIFDRQYVSLTLPSTYETHGGPVFINGVYYTWGNYNPTQELVDEFYMANGKSIKDPTSGYDPQNPYVGREPRFYAWIVYDGAPYKMDWMQKEDIIYTRIDKVNPSLNEIDFGNGDVSNTGYFFKKKLQPHVVPGSGLSGGNLIYYRYAEVLLGYAEAQNEAVGPDESVYDAINQIRAHAGIPDLSSGLSQGQMRNEIRKQRRVELCFENKRFYDIIRWKIAEEVMNEDRHGMKIYNSVPEDNSGVWIYEPIPLNHPHTFNQRQYLNPIPLPVITQNPNLVQNPGYQN